ncbi:Protein DETOXIFICATION 44, chloroplastic [Gracilariopsis chorda]|uniref:Protein DETOXIFICATION 44, chloroplastic n=1 Tax=Gracilariopsis chorda TaxID=448386 RepID=A0A2V3J5I0_9FLOR|nr:Protein DETOXIFICATION 44, chloroplastic [Gracilariopsis chorda]|eukprot:PXF48630.1 Protein DETOXIFICATION 44, chloroplastic [Gracilariopsis chorda]
MASSHATLTFAPTLSPRPYRHHGTRSLSVRPHSVRVSRLPARFRTQSRRNFPRFLAASAIGQEPPSPTASEAVPNEAATEQPAPISVSKPPSIADIDRSIASISLPALATLSLDPLVALADMACVGYLGASAIGGVGIGNNVFNLSFTCFNFLGMATTPAIARAYASSKHAEASRLIAQALWVALVSGLSATLVLLLYTQPILSFFGANAAILPQARAYLRARIIAAPFFLAAMVGNGAFRGYQDTKTPLFVGLFANVLNLILYPSLIFGVKLGTRGAGMAMAIGQTCAGATLLLLLVKTGKLRLRDLARPPRANEIIPLLRTGAVLSVRTLSIFSTISFATATAARLGTVQVAAFEIGRQIFALFARLLDAISVAAQSLVALALGKNDYMLARRTANRILQIGVTMGCGFAALLILTIRTAPTIFTSNPAVREMVSLTFPFMAFVQPINGLVFVFDGIYTAGRKFTSLAAAICLAASSASLFLYFVRTTSMPLQFVWVGLNIMMVLRATLLGLMYFTKRSPVPRPKHMPVGNAEG